jgi:D-sedoheptulose 7-phosphate isomerase
MRIENPPRDLPTMVARRFEWSMAVPEVFFAREEKRIAEACWAMARRFHQGGRLLAFGNGAWTTDAQHVVVDFMHPVIVGKRALPALALTNDGSSTSSFADQLHILARPQDIALGFSLVENCADVVVALAEARQAGLLTLGLTGGDGGLFQEHAPDFLFAVNTHDQLVIQETHETLYHVLWELVHIFFEHEGLLA